MDSIRAEEELFRKAVWRAKDWLHSCGAEPVIGEANADYVARLLVQFTRDMCYEARSLGIIHEPHTCDSVRFFGYTNRKAYAPWLPESE